MYNDWVNNLLGLLHISPSMMLTILYPILCFSYSYMCTLDWCSCYGCQTTTVTTHSGHNEQIYSAHLNDILMLYGVQLLKFIAYSACEWVWFVEIYFILHNLQCTRTWCVCLRYSVVHHQQFVGQWLLTMWVHNSFACMSTGWIRMEIMLLLIMKKQNNAKLNYQTHIVVFFFFHQRKRICY